MTIFKELLVVILITFCINLMGVLWLQFDSTRDYLVSQLESDLNNVSTSLTMAISPHLASGDEVMIDSTLHAYFDGGFYQKIEVTMYETGEVIVKEAPTTVEGVPQWFIDLNFLRVPFIENEVTNGWSQVGKIFVSGHPGLAYKQLWDSFVSTCLWLTSLGVLVSGVCAYGINIVLKPLIRIQQKAQEIQEHYFGDPLPLPSTKELRDVTEAVNQMSFRLQEQFEEKARLHEKLKQAAFIDSITGFGNRSYFERRLNSWIMESCNGVLILIEIDGLNDLSHEEGWMKRDDALVVIGHFIDNVFEGEEKVTKCRVSDHEFALILEETELRKAEQKLKQLSTYFSSPEMREMFKSNKIFVSGGVKVSHRADKSDILAMADRAVQEAREGFSGIKIIEMSPDTGHIHTREEIKTGIERAIAKDAYIFINQPVFTYKQKDPDHFEIFTNLQLEDLTNVTAGTFVSVLNEYKLGTKFDKRVIQYMIDYAKKSDNGPFAVNISTSALQDHQFVVWLYNKLKHEPITKEKVVFEFNEDSIINDKENTEEMCRYLTELGVRFGIDRVGRHFESLAYLQRIHPDYVKVDHSYTEIAVNNQQDAYFVGSLCTTIHNLDIKVIATHVENEKQLELLKDYHFDGFQGYIVKPTKLEDL